VVVVRKSVAKENREGVKLGEPERLLRCFSVAILMEICPYTRGQGTAVAAEYEYVAILMEICPYTRARIHAIVI
jgi:hypothetical protein